MANNNLKAVGLNNKLYNIQVTIDGAPINDGIQKLMDQIYKQFEIWDKEINDKLPESVYCSKTSNNKQFDTSQIMKSLLTLGITLNGAFNIVVIAIQKILNYINKEVPSSINTAQIRMFVSNSIQELDISKYHYTDDNIENWASKYARRYGNNNRQITVYNYNNGIANINHAFVADVLLKDIIYDITESDDIYNDLTRRQSDDLSHEIVEFITNCDINSINYDVLKNMIIEIATQPPHPWFTNEKLKTGIIDYDLKKLSEHYKKLTLYKENNYENNDNLLAKVSRQTVIEMLHHTSSALLAQYDKFLGCNSLSSFYIFYELLKKYSLKNYQELMYGDYTFAQFDTDLNMIDDDLYETLQLLEDIKKELDRNGKINERIVNLLIKYYKICIKVLTDSKNREKIIEFLKQNWDGLENQDIIENLKIIFKIIPRSRISVIVNGESDFCFKVINEQIVSVFQELKKQILVIYLDKNSKNIERISDLHCVDMRYVI